MYPLFVATRGDAVAARRTSSPVRLLRLHVRARRAAELDVPESSAESCLGESSLVTAPYVRGGRVC